jgi:hypothetical protein
VAVYVDPTVVLLDVPALAHAIQVKSVQLRSLSKNRNRALNRLNRRQANHIPLQVYDAIPILVDVHSLGNGVTYFQSVLAGKAFVTVSTWEWLYCTMYPPMSLEVVVAVKALRTLITFERPVDRSSL